MPVALAQQTAPQCLVGASLERALSATLSFDGVLSLDGVPSLSDARYWLRVSVATRATSN